MKLKWYPGGGAWLNPLSTTDVLSSILLKYSICCPPFWRAEPGRAAAKKPHFSLFLSLSSSQLQQCSWQNPTPKIRVLFPVISGLILIWFNPCTDRFDSSCLFMYFCRPSLPGQSDYRLRGVVFFLPGPISTQARKCTYMQKFWYEKKSLASVSNFLKHTHKKS